jgi:hypothetical protein
MPFVPEDDLDDPAERPGGPRPILPTNEAGGLARDELAAALAARGQRVIGEAEAAVELARRRRRIDQGGDVAAAAARRTR